MQLRLGILGILESLVLVPIAVGFGARFSVRNFGWESVRDALGEPGLEMHP